VVSASKNKKGRFLPQEFDAAHQLCFVIHDVMVQMIMSGEEGNVFNATVDFKDTDEGDRISELEDIDQVFSWLDEEGRSEDKAKILQATVLPAILSDMMHCYFEALETSRKGKLGISYMLIRKPLQESLYVLESIVLDKLEFSELLSSKPQKLGSHNSGGVTGHEKRVTEVLSKLNLASRFNPKYISQLRYDKKEEDSFDGICNKAMHLFTSHDAIRTERMNINFIFSGEDQKISQWNYLYSRLPYLLMYTLFVVEHIMERVAPTTKKYLDNIQRRISASILLWWENVEERYKSEEIQIFVNETTVWLNDHCKNSEYSLPQAKDLIRMSETGAFPKEKRGYVKKRGLKYKVHAAINGMAEK
jgi:hypothetical protein